MQNFDFTFSMSPSTLTSKKMEDAPKKNSVRVEILSPDDGKAVFERTVCITAEVNAAIIDAPRATPYFRQPTPQQPPLAQPHNY